MCPLMSSRTRPSPHKNLVLAGECSLGCALSIDTKYLQFYRLSFAETTKSADSLSLWLKIDAFQTGKSPSEQTDMNELRMVPGTLGIHK